MPRAACEASQIEFPVDYAALNRSSITRLSEAKRLLMLLSQDALVQLHDGHPAAALADVRAGLQFVAHWDREPLLITQLVRLALARVLVDATWQLLQFPDWSDAELAQLQAAWQELDLPATAVWTAQMEVALADEALQRLTRNQYLAEEARLAKWAETTRQRGGNPLPANGLLKRFTDRHPRWLAFWLWRRDQFALIHLQQYEAFEEVCREAATKGAWFDPIQRKAPTFARLDEARPLLPEFVANGTIGLKNVPVRYAEYECERQLVLTAIALERFRKAHGHLPDRLASLTPAFLASVPCDPMDGQPLRYRQKGEGSFMLYSVGADGRDDDGDPTRPPASAANWRRKDLVWPQAASVSEGLAALATGHVSYAASQQWFAQRYGLTNAAPDAPPQMSEEMKQRFLRRYGTLPPGVQLLAPTNQPAARTNQ
jgi:hypothetical protein